jgi:Glycosyltransferase family 87
MTSVRDGQERAAPASRLLAAGLAAIAVSLLIMLVVSVNGPSVSVPGLTHPDAFGAGPPWWHPLHLRPSVVLLSLWAAAVIAVAGVTAGLLAVSRGARLPVRPLLAGVFLVIAVFTVLPPGGSTDAVSYGIDGSMVAAGHSPYVMTPNQFLATGAQIARNSPKTWQNSLSDYGPLATASEWAAAELGGTSMARITFWVKVWTSLAFCAVVLLLDWLLRPDPAMRWRAHLLWSANPVLLWEIVAGGHIDGIAVALGLAGIVVLRVTTRGGDPGLVRATAAGVLIGAAIAIKAPFALYALGAAWALRRHLAAVSALATGCLVALAAPYLAAGRPAVTVLFDRGNQVTWDNLYQAFWRPLGYSTYQPAHLVDVAAVLTVTVAVITCLRLPSRVPSLPAVTPSLALSLAWIFMWPFQRPWYDVMIIALLVLYPASRLDWVVLTRLGFAAITYMDAIGLPPGRLLRLQMFEGEWITSTVRLLSVAALLWLCLSGRWGWRTRPAESAITEPELQPLT